MKPIRGQRSYYFADTLKPITASDMPPQVPPIRRYLVRLLSRNKARIDYGRGGLPAKIEIFCWMRIGCQVLFFCLFVCLNMFLANPFQRAKFHATLLLPQLQVFAVESRWLSTKLENNCYSSEMGKKAVALVPSTLK